MPNVRNHMPCQHIECQNSLFCHHGLHQNSFHHYKGGEKMMLNITEKTVKSNANFLLCEYSLGSF